MEKYKLFLDDIRDPGTHMDYMNNSMYIDQDWVVVRNYDDFIEVIQKAGLPEIISFDHDLADEHYIPQKYWNTEHAIAYSQLPFKEKTGLDCARWLREYCWENKLMLPAIFCHSMNPIGKENILNCFR